MEEKAKIYFLVGLENVKGNGTARQVYLFILSCDEKMINNRS